MKVIVDFKKGIFLVVFNQTHQERKILFQKEIVLSVTKIIFFLLLQVCPKFYWLLLFQNLSYCKGSWEAIREGWFEVGIKFVSCKQVAWGYPTLILQTHSLSHHGWSTEFWVLDSSHSLSFQMNQKNPLNGTLCELYDIHWWWQHFIL